MSRNPVVRLKVTIDSALHQELLSKLLPRVTRSSSYRWRRLSNIMKTAELHDSGIVTMLMSESELTKFKEVFLANVMVETLVYVHPLHIPASSL